MKTLIAFVTAAVTLSANLAAAQTAAEFRSQFARHAINSLCEQEMNLLGQFIGKRAAGMSRDQLLVQIDDYVTAKQQPAELEQLHVLMLNTAFTGTKLTPADFQGDKPSPHAQAIVAKGHIACVQYMNTLNSDR
ncbi:hypothetical protein U0E18_24435 [Burkholderia pseudomallei]|uniref:hypothetical protein n=1 Tax=Burkholderia pseudomallei TaxID=28450 RepID=UPI002AB43F72|nr:hypothetical protein [Burkholderia pseudomallei]MDY7761336.1 hypothetical protein [Burkholderia pseudomallei]